MSGKQDSIGVMEQPSIIGKYIFKALNLVWNDIHIFRCFCKVWQLWPIRPEPVIYIYYI